MWLNLNKAGYPRSQFLSVNFQHLDQSAATQSFAVIIKFVNVRKVIVFISEVLRYIVSLKLESGALLCVCIWLGIHPNELIKSVLSLQHCRCLWLRDFSARWINSGYLDHLSRRYTWRGEVTAIDRCTRRQDGASSAVFLHSGKTPVYH